jgi:hypothetical protein
MKKRRPRGRVLSPDGALQRTRQLPNQYPRRGASRVQRAEHPPTPAPAAALDQLLDQDLEEPPVDEQHADMDAGCVSDAGSDAGLSAAEDEDEDEDEDEEQAPAGQQAAAAASTRPSPSPALDNDRPQLQQQYFTQLLPNLQLHRQLMDAQAEVYRQLGRAPLCSCPHCHTFTQHTAVDTRPPRTVFLCSLLAIQLLQVPAVQCGSCQHVHHPSPLVLGCVPGTANALGTNKKQGLPVWFSMQLLQHADASEVEQRRHSNYGYVAALEHGWRTSMQAAALPADAATQLQGLPDGFASVELPLPLDTLRRQLAAALREWRYAHSRAITLPEQLPGYPTGPGQPCAACLPQELQLSYDMCFKLTLLGRKGYTTDYLQPDNSRVFQLSNAELQQQLAAVDSTMEQQQRALGPEAAAALAAPVARVPYLPAAAATQGGGAAAAAAGSGGSGHAASDAAEEAAACDAACSQFRADKLAAPASRKVRTVGLGGVADVVPLAIPGCRGHGAACVDTGMHKVCTLCMWLLLLAVADTAHCQMHAKVPTSCCDCATHGCAPLLTVGPPATLLVCRRSSRRWA